MKELQREVYEIAKAKGFHDRDDDAPSAVEVELSWITGHIGALAADVEYAREHYDNAPDETLENDGDRQKIRILARLALVHSEIAEAADEVNEAPIYFVNGKPEGYAIELADAVIRIMDTCEWLGVDLENAIRLKMEYNRGRPHMHGKKI